MQYLLLIYEDEDVNADMPEAERGPYMQRWFDYTQALKEAGVYVGGNALKPVDTATTVRVREGQVLHTDGPFAETREQLGGYYLVEVDNLDEALKWAARMPNADTGSVEVRPLMVFG